MLNQLLEHPVPVGVAFADLNGLKYLNDTYGHEYGDQALRHLAEVSMEYFAKDQLYRVSGDEFVIICPEVPGRGLYQAGSASEGTSETGGTGAGCLWVSVE